MPWQLCSSVTIRSSFDDGPAWTTVVQVQASDLRRMDEISKDVLREKDNRLNGLRGVRTSLERGLLSFD